MKDRQRTPLATPTDLGAATREISGAMNLLLADVFAPYLKTKHFHWHLSGPHFRDYHLLFDEQAQQIFSMADPIRELDLTHRPEAAPREAVVKVIPVDLRRRSAF